MVLKLRSSHISVCLLMGAALSLGTPVQGATSTLANPIVTFATPGSKQVSLQTCNAVGCDTETKTVTSRWFDDTPVTGPNMTIQLK